MWGVLLNTQHGAAAAVHIIPSHSDPELKILIDLLYTNPPAVYTERGGVIDELLCLILRRGCIWQSVFEARSCWLPAGPTPVSWSELRAKKSTKPDGWRRMYSVWGCHLMMGETVDGVVCNSGTRWPRRRTRLDLVLTEPAWLFREGGWLCFCTWDRCWGASSSAAFISVEMRACVWIRRHSALSTQPHKSDLLVCFWVFFLFCFLSGLHQNTHFLLTCKHKSLWDAHGALTLPPWGQGLLCLAVVTSD